MKILKKDMKELLNFFGKKRVPIFFMISFDKSRYFIKPLKELDKDIFFTIDQPLRGVNTTISYSFEAVDFNRYKKAFLQVQEEIKSGNTYLLNLTFPSKFFSEYDLKKIYHISDAKFKLFFKDKFVCFSPERFVKIEDDFIYTYPMKGTIQANIPDAKNKILSNKKEMAEHVMVVDLLRNDLNMVSKGVMVEKFRYIEKIKAGNKELLQVSSKIKGIMPSSWQDNLGDILDRLLPAGSISGTPKKSSVEIIKKVEGYDRGFFTGIFGVFDGKNLDSAVMIRFIEKINGEYYYKSGGGITIDSDLTKEYEELKEKIYVPVF